MPFKSYLGRTDLPKGLRNNNPGNLIKTNINWNGEVLVNTDGHFEQFIELRYGIRALMRDLINDIQKGKTNVAALITEFAPAFENNTASYINSVVNSIGTAIVGQLTQEVLIGLCKAIIRVEIGSGYTSYVTDNDYQDAIAILGYSLPKKKVAS